MTGIYKNHCTRLRCFLAALLLCAAAATLLSPAALASGGEKTASAQISTGVSGTAEVTFPWNDAWFSRDSKTYLHQLAVASLALSGAAYLGGGDTGVQEALTDLGFTGVQAYNYHLSAEKAGRAAAYVFARKKVPAADGGSVWLTAVVIRGTGDYMEWAGNLNMGSGADHAGFAKARDELLENLEKYFSSAGIGGRELEAARFLITGHSRGGAVANLTAASLTAGGREGVYAYTFASPAVSFQAAAEGYENIFNIVSREDLVTQVPLSDWGCGRYGADLHLPTRERWGDAYDAAFEKMDRRYTALTGQPYAVYQNPSAVDQMTAAIRQLAPDASGASLAMLSALLGGNLEGLAELIHSNSLAALLLGRRAIALSAELTPLLQQESEGMVSAHCMAGYYSWLTAWDTPEEADSLFAGDLSRYSQQS